MDCMQSPHTLNIVADDGCFNTASGMDCMQYARRKIFMTCFLVSIPQAVWIACNPHFAEWTDHYVSFQYRKRYGLHAISGFRKRSKSNPRVSIPQAVWIACNDRYAREHRAAEPFQYRKRYGLHAMKHSSIIVIQS